MKRARMDPRLKQIGMIRYMDAYHPTDEQSRARLVELACHIKASPETIMTVPRGLTKVFARMARPYGFQVHFFERALGR